jgi:diguanylate cyclase (GGDEF)-like protein
MVLALFTSYQRSGRVQFELLEEALRRARALGDPTLLLAVLNNYAWAAQETEEGFSRAVELVDELETMIEAGTAVAAAPVLDTVAWVRFAQGDLVEAERLLSEAVSSELHVEPDGHAAIMAHLAEVRRKQGRIDEAGELLERARAVASIAKTPDVGVAVLRQLAELDAERGDYKRAYRRLLRFVGEQSAAERAESERRATVLQSIYGAQIERDQRMYYEELATRDPLTGLYNRRHVESQLPLMLKDGGVTVAMIDVDHFKTINDHHTHQAGDAILRQLAELLRLHARSMGADAFAARLGGEEFLIAAPGGRRSLAVASMEQLRTQVASHRWGSVPTSVRPTVSIGLVVSSGAGQTSSALLSEADQLLYLAKANGRNQVQMVVL